MRNVIFIISHKRPECLTAKALKKVGYSGEWFVVADDLDETDYESRYPGRVKRFCKKEYAAIVDTADNLGKMTTPVYARNACFDLAKQGGYDCFGLFDDDLQSFVIRVIEDNKLVSKKIKDFTPIFEAYCKYIVDAKFAAGGFVAAGRLVGGINNKLASEKFYYNPTNAYVINTHVEQFPFIGTLWEDSTYCYLNNMTGRVVAGFLPVVISMVSPGAMKNGGNKELYASSSNFIAENYGNIIIPSFFKWTKGGSKHQFSSDLPKIISERWRKK